MENLCVPIFGQKNILRQQHPFFIGEAVLAAGATAASVVGAGERLPTRQQMVRVLSAARLQKQWDDVRLRVLRRLGGERDAGSRRS